MRAKRTKAHRVGDCERSEPEPMEWARKTAEVLGGGEAGSGAQAQKIFEF